MKNSSVNHPSFEQLSAFLLGHSKIGDRPAIEEHIESCDECCAALANVPGDAMTNLARDAATLITLTKKLPEFKHHQREEAFRNWLHLVTVNSLRNFWRGKPIRSKAKSGTDFQSVLVNLEDPNSELAANWNREYGLLITQQVLSQIRLDFDEMTWRALERTTFDGAPAADVAFELGMTVNAVYLAKSRIMTKLRQEMGRLIN